MNEISSNEEVIKCIFLCEFHTTVGTKIVEQTPANYITKDIFDKASNYVIPKHQLITNRCFISISLGDLKIIGLPTCIENHHIYNRNQFYFNLCFVFDSLTATTNYESIIRKTTEHLLSLELSSKFLSKLDDDKAKRLENMLCRIRTDVNARGSCMLQDGQNMLSLCIVPFYEDKLDQIENMGDLAHKSPVLLDSFLENYALNSWDLTTQKIVPFINGFRHITRIAQLAEVSTTIVSQCVKHLVLLGVAVLIPAFQYSNIYRPTPKLNQLAKSLEVQKRAIEKCSKSELKKAKIRDILLLFASMTHGATLGELCVRFNPAKHNIDERKTVLFGLVENLIRPIFKYPIDTGKNLFVGYDNCNNGNRNTTYDIPISNNNKRASVDSVKITRNSFTGLKTLDEICMKMSCSTRQLEEQLAYDKHVIVLLK